MVMTCTIPVGQAFVHLAWRPKGRSATAPSVLRHFCGQIPGRRNMLAHEEKLDWIMLSRRGRLGR
jgi:hypothetical protein